MSPPLPHRWCKAIQYARTVRVRATQLLTVRCRHLDPLTEQQADIDIPETESDTDPKSQNVDT